MKLYDGGMLMIIGILAGIALASIAATKLLDLEDDNEIEEFVEEIIEIKTGLD